MTTVVTCEVCGHRMALAREILIPQSFRMRCQACESLLEVEVTAADLRAGGQISAGRANGA